MPVERLSHDLKRIRRQCREEHVNEASGDLAAMTIFATMFEKDPTALPVEGMVPKQYKAAMDTAAKNAVLNTPEIPAEYRTSSVGVTGK